MCICPFLHWDNVHLHAKHDEIILGCHLFEKLATRDLKMKLFGSLN